MTYDFSNLPREIANGIQMWIDGEDGVHEGIYRTLGDNAPDIVLREENGVSVARLVWRQTSLAECQARLEQLAIARRQELDNLAAKLSTKTEEFNDLQGWRNTVAMAEGS